MRPKAAQHQQAPTLALQQLPTLPLPQMPKQLLQHMLLLPLRQSVQCKNSWCALQALPGQHSLLPSITLYVTRGSIGCHSFPCRFSKRINPQVAK